MKKLTSFFLLLIFSGFSFGKYVQTCEVKYKTNEGWSKKYTVDVTFMTGSELNQASKSFDYNSYSVYGLIWWGKGEVTIIKLTTTLLCGQEVDKNCISNLYPDLKGKDQDGDEWNICLRSFCY